MNTVESAAAAMRRINQLWVDGRVEELAPMVHPDIVMAVPGFADRISGRKEFLAGFADFCESAKIGEFRDYDYESDVIGHVAVITFGMRCFTSALVGDIALLGGISGCSAEKATSG